MNLTSLTPVTSPITTNPHVTFLYPKGTQYPFDEVCEKIVRVLEKRNWNTSGIEVNFVNDTLGRQTFRRVTKISGNNFRLTFGREQGRIAPGLKDLAAVHEIVIPKRELTVYAEEEGPNYRIYAGDNWYRDEHTFMNGGRLQSKLYNEPKIYLIYGGALNPQSENGWRGKRYGGGNNRNPYLVNDDDVGREYRANEDEPKYFHTDQVYQEIQAWLESNVLWRL